MKDTKAKVAPGLTARLSWTPAVGKMGQSLRPTPPTGGLLIRGDATARILAEREEKGRTSRFESEAEFQKIILSRRSI
jgi:hypothetical protein